MRTLATLAILLGFGCQPNVTDSLAAAQDGRAASALADDLDMFDLELAKARHSVDRLHSSWRPVVDSYRRAANRLADARATLQRATTTANEATANASLAAARAHDAEVMFEIAQAMVLVAAQIDAGNLDSYRRWRARPPTVDARFDCAPVSTAQFRRHLIALGINLAGMDIDHIVPRSLGGADHPSNYQILESSTNRALGNAWGREKCVAAGSKCGEAVAVSMRCGSYSGPRF